MVVNEISMALTSLKAIVEITKSILGMSKDIGFKEKIIELQNEILTFQSHILSMHSEYSKLIEVKNQLEKKLMEYENWDKTKSQYELKEVAPSVFVYVPQKNSEFAKPDHWLCTNCFDDSNKCILQRKHRPAQRGAGYYFCPKCKTEICIPPGYMDKQRL